MSEKYTKNGNKVEFQIEIQNKDIEKAMQEAYLKERKHFALPGFRKGRVPRQIIEANYGNDIFFEDAINNVLPDLYEEKTKELELKLAGQPTVTIANPYEKGKDVIVDIEVEVMPEIEVKDYSKIPVEKVEYEMDEEMVSIELDRQRQKSARMTIIEDRPIKEGDTAVIDFVGKVDEVEFEGGAGEDVELEIGSATFIPGFEEQLVGKSAGDDVEVKVTFPEEYHVEDLKGKDAIFDVKVKEIREITLPELDDEFVKDISEFDTLEEYKADIRKNLEEQLKENEKMEIRNRLLAKVSGLADFEVPELLIEEQIDREINNFAQNIQAQGLDFNQYVEILGGDINRIRDDFRETAYNNVKTRLILDEIASREEIKATEEDIEKEIDEMAELYSGGNEERKEEFKENLKNSADFLEEMLKERKTIDFLVENIEFFEPEIAEEVAEETVEEKTEDEE